MKICKQGHGHYVDGINNQDYYVMENNLKIITDGCTGEKYSEVGTRLFAQYFLMLDSKFDYDQFENNVLKTFKNITKNIDESKVEEFVSSNMMFTIIACFEFEDKYIVKVMGDGYIIAINNQDQISYIRLSYGEYPPYYGYNLLKDVRELKFKEFVFPKEEFKKIGIASDGFDPIAKGKISEDVKEYLLSDESEYFSNVILKMNQNLLYDDLTILL